MELNKPKMQVLVNSVKDVKLSNLIGSDHCWWRRQVCTRYHGQGGHSEEVTKLSKVRGREVSPVRI